MSQRAISGWKRHLPRPIVVPPHPDLRGCIPEVIEISSTSCSTVTQYDRFGRRNASNQHNQTVCPRKIALLACLPKRIRRLATNSRKVVHENPESRRNEKKEEIRPVELVFDNKASCSILSTPLTTGVLFMPVHHSLERTCVFLIGVVTVVVWTSLYSANHEFVAIGSYFQ
jgi:hypothetical protein